MTRQPVLPVKEHFLIVEDDKGRKEVLLTEDGYSLGRGKNCDIVLHSQFVSRYHATIFRFAREDGQGFYRIVDGDREGRASANGLLVNGKKVSSAELKDGDEVVFGPQVFAIYKCRQRDKFPTIPTNDPFDITLIDPAMMVNDDES